MTEKIKQTLRDSNSARWTVLVLVSITMAAGYFFTDVLSPLEELLITSLKWDGEQYGFFAGQYSFLNIIGFIILGGVILDKLGIRFTGTLFILLMIFGGITKAYGVSEYFNNGGFAYDFFDSFLTKYRPSVKVATLGYAIFGLGVEIAGVTVNRVIVKWFKGKELALAMGLQMAVARLGMGAAFLLAPRIAENISVSKPVIWGLLLLVIGLITFLIHCMMDVKLDKETIAKNPNDKEEDEAFKLSNITTLFTNKGFVLIAILCVLFYSCVFPFMKFAANLMSNKYGVDAETAGLIAFILPFGTVLLTPIFGSYIDKKGKSASMMVLGSILLIVVHSIFTFLPGNVIFAYIAMFILGVAFSLVPSAMWPSVPKIVAENRLGTAYALIFWVQNIGLWLVPMLIGGIREWSNPGITLQKQQGLDVVYNYTNPMLMLVIIGFIALFFAFLLKKTDKKESYGLELPNIKN